MSRKESHSTKNSQPQTEAMEVHHHKVEKKKFKEYFLEFLMLFLAVTLGFFAENIREHSIEHKRMRQYAGLLVADLERDTAWFNNEKGQWEQRQPNFDTLISLLVQPVSAPDDRVLKNLFHINYVSNAKLNTATYNQMRASGSLRYVNDLDLMTALEDYYEIRIPRALESSQSTLAFFDSYIKTFFIDHLRNQDMHPDNISKRWNPVVIGRTRELDQRLSNIIDMDRTQLGIANRFYDSANKKADELITLIKEEYHLKND